MRCIIHGCKCTPCVAPHTLSAAWKIIVAFAISCIHLLGERYQIVQRTWGWLLLNMNASSINNMAFILNSNVRGEGRCPHLSSGHLDRYKPLVPPLVSVHSHVRSIAPQQASWAAARNALQLPLSSRGPSSAGTPWKLSYPPKITMQTMFNDHCRVL